MRKMVGQARSRRSSGECSAEKRKVSGMTRKEMKMKARIIAMERLLKEIREIASNTDLMDRQALVRAMGGIEYASSEDTIEEIYRFEYSHVQRIESEKKWKAEWEAREEEVHRRIELERSRKFLYHERL